MSHRLAASRLVFLRILLALLLHAGFLETCTAAATGAPCETAEPILLGNPVLKYRKDLEGTDLFRINFSTAGLLMLHGSSDTHEDTQPRLAFLGDSCTGGGDYTVLRETPTGMVLWIARRGVHYLEVSAEDPEQPLFFYKLQTVFVAESPSKDVDPIDDDDVPVGGLVDPDIFPVCDLSGADDYPDIPLCGTPLTVGTSTVGTLDSATDDDYLRFELAGLVTVVIEAHSDGPAAIVLYDESGQRLESRSCPNSCKMRIVRTLGLGHYDLQIASEGAVGEGYLVKVVALAFDRSRQYAGGSR